MDPDNALCKLFRVDTSPPDYYTDIDRTKKKCLSFVMCNCNNIHCIRRALDVIVEPLQTPHAFSAHSTSEMVERNRVVRTCLYFALICYFLTKVCESVNKFRNGKISMAEEEVHILVFSILTIGQVTTLQLYRHT